MLMSFTALHYVRVAGLEPAYFTVGWLASTATFSRGDLCRLSQIPFPVQKNLQQNNSTILLSPLRVARWGYLKPLAYLSPLPPARLMKFSPSSEWAWGFLLRNIWRCRACLVYQSHLEDRAGVEPAVPGLR